MPEIKKKVVVFARQNTILSQKGSATGLSEAAIAAGGDALKQSPKKSNLRKFNKLLEPFKKREIKLLSHLKRSNSFNWTPAEKPTIHNLYQDPDKPAMLDRLKLNSINSGSSISTASPLKQPLDGVARIAGGLIGNKRKNLKFLDSSLQSKGR